MFNKNELDLGWMDSDKHCVNGVDVMQYNFTKTDSSQRWSYITDTFTYNASTAFVNYLIKDTRFR